MLGAHRPDMEATFGHGQRLLTVAFPVRCTLLIGSQAMACGAAYPRLIVRRREVLPAQRLAASTTEFMCAALQTVSDRDSFIEYKTLTAPQARFLG